MNVVAVLLLVPAVVLKNVLNAVAVLLLVPAVVPNVVLKTVDVLFDVCAVVLKNVTNDVFLVVSLLVAKLVSKKVCFSPIPARIRAMGFIYYSLR